MFKNKIEKDLLKAVVDLGFVKPVDTVVSISEKSQFGDYSSNIALQLSKQSHQKDYQNPREIANAIIKHFGHPEYLERIELAGPGFINFYLKDSQLASLIANRDSQEDERTTNNERRTIIVEYCEPNTHKMLHIGHLLSLVLGETLSRLFEYQGASVIRTNYGSDIGLTVGKCLWGVEKLKAEYEKVKASGSLREKAEFLGKAYAYAHGEYEKSVEAKEEIDQITNKLYQRDSSIIPLWEETKEWSLGYFEIIYSIFGTLFDRRINESEVDRMGKQIVLEHVGKIFEEDQGAIIYPGEKYGLHNRVFINSKGNPTYEAKDIGLADKYIEMYQFDEIHIFSHKEQDDYFKVIIDAENRVFPEIKNKVHHVSYGEVKLSSGKMSSRTGNVIAAEDIFNQVKEKILEVSKASKGSDGSKAGVGIDDLTLQKLAVGAIKFAFLKYSPKSDIVYDIEESVSLHGDTGPYVLYVFARINSLLKKSQTSQMSQKESKDLEEEENRAIEDELDEDDDEAQEEEIAQDAEESDDIKESKDKRHLTPLTQTVSLDSSDSLVLEPEEREILRQLEYFDIIAKKAAENFQPNELVKYLLTLTKAFNAFYEKHPIIGSKTQEFRLQLASRVAEQIKLGLYLLGIETVDKM